MKASQRKPGGKIALALGLITGALTGLLFAPEEGKKTREKIAKGDAKGLLGSMQEMGEELKGLVMEIATRPGVKEVLGRAKNSIADAAQVERAELDRILKNANAKADKFRKSVETYVKERKADLDGFLKTSPAAQKATKKAVKKTVKKAVKTVKKTVKPVTKALAKKPAPAKKKASTPKKKK